MAGDTINFVHQLGNFDLNLHPIFGGINTVGRLYGKFPYPVQNVLGFLQIPLGGLDKRHAVLNIPFRLVQTPDLAPHFLGNREAGSVIRRLVDPLAGTEVLDVFATSPWVTPSWRFEYMVLML